MIAELGRGVGSKMQRQEVDEGADDVVRFALDTICVTNTEGNIFTIAYRGISKEQYSEDSEVKLERDGPVLPKHTTDRFIHFCFDREV
jgi:hypothetical protein